MRFCDIIWNFFIGDLPRKGTFFSKPNSSDKSISIWSLSPVPTTYKCASLYFSHTIFIAFNKVPNCRILDKAPTYIYVGFVIDEGYSVTLKISKFAPLG